MIKKFNCLNCDTSFNRKAHLEQHLNKKKPCVNNSIMQDNNMCITITNIHTIIDNKLENQNDNKNDNKNEDDNKNDNKNEDDNKNENEDENKIKFECNFCHNFFSRKFNLDRHLNGRCKSKPKKRSILTEQNNVKTDSEIDNKIDGKIDGKIDSKIYSKIDVVSEKLNNLENENNKLKQQISNLIPKKNEITKIHKTIKKLETSIPANTNLVISNQLVEQLIIKDKRIEQLIDTSSKMNNKINLANDNKINLTNDNKIDDTNINIIEKDEKEEKEEKTMTLILNDCIVECRNSDGYVNAVQLCEAGKKQFNDWLELETTKNIIDNFKKSLSINKIEKINPILIDIKKNNNDDLKQEIWIHPDLAIQMAYWISPFFSIQVSYWIRTSFINKKIGMSDKMLKEKENTILNHAKKIKHLENMILKRHSRKELDNEFNVVYLITCDELMINRKYIIGRTKNLLNRLSQYNKMSTYRVVYSKSFKNNSDTKYAELAILRALENYKEFTNHDRFILPIDKDIDYFKMAFDDVSKCFSY
jgi:hypothetical protein